MNRLVYRIGGKLLGILALTFVVSVFVRADDAPTIYKAKCAACHGPDGTGNTTVGKALKVRDLHDPDVQKQSDADLSAIISKGREKMPEYDKSLKPDEIKALVAYVRDIGGKK